MVVENGALVPSLWRLEVANSLTVAVRRGRIGAEFRNAALADLALLDIATDAHTDAHSWTTTLHIWSWSIGVRCPLPRWTRNCAMPVALPGFRCSGPQCEKA